MNIKNSKYWEQEISKTQDYLSQLVHGELAGIKSTKSSDDTISMQEVDKEIQKCKTYLAYCQQEYQKALDIENGVKTETSTSILYFNREYGY